MYIRKNMDMEQGTDEKKIAHKFSSPFSSSKVQPSFDLCLCPLVLKVYLRVELRYTKQLNLNGYIGANIKGEGFVNNGEFAL